MTKSRTKEQQERIKKKLKEIRKYFEKRGIFRKKRK